MDAQHHTHYVEPEPDHTPNNPPVPNSSQPVGPTGFVPTPYISHYFVGIFSYRVKFDVHTRPHHLNVMYAEAMLERLKQIRTWSTPKATTRIIYDIMDTLVHMYRLFSARRMLIRDRNDCFVFDFHMNMCPLCGNHPPIMILARQLFEDGRKGGLLLDMEYYPDGMWEIIDFKPAGY